MTLEFGKFLSKLDLNYIYNVILYKVIKLPGLTRTDEMTKQNLCYWLHETLIMFYEY